MAWRYKSYLSKSESIKGTDEKAEGSGRRIRNAYAHDRSDDLNQLINKINEVKN